jgi:hypothetical protein
MAETGTSRPGRNAPCHCGSGKKYKHCCLAKDEEAERASRAQQVSAAQPPMPPEDETSPRTTPPPRATVQPWKHAAQRGTGPRRITTPRKAG